MLGCSRPIFFKLILPKQNYNKFLNKMIEFLGIIKYGGLMLIVGDF